MQWNVSDGKTHHINTQTIYNESNALLSAIALDKCEKWRQQTEKKKRFIHKDNFFFGLMVRQTQMKNEKQYETPTTRRETWKPISEKWVKMNEKEITITLMCTFHILCQFAFSFLPFHSSFCFLCFVAFWFMTFERVFFSLNLFCICRQINFLQVYDKSINFLLTHFHLQR